MAAVADLFSFTESRCHMCRLAAYAGPEIPLQNIVTAPRNSLLAQSLNAIEAKTVVNGDGFGIAWYEKNRGPGLYRDCYPAWSDANLLSLCEMVRSPLFIAHVRASTVGESSRTNCHPFAHRGWSFAHNGQIGDFRRMQRQLEESLSDELYLARNGTTDSEVLFLALLEADLANPLKASNKVITQLENLRTALDIAAPLRLTFVMTEGSILYGVRYASDQFAPSLYWSKKLDNDGCCIASEPLDGRSDNWTEVPAQSMITLENGVTRVDPLTIG